MAFPVPPYGVAIRDAIASGDVDKMQSTAADAEKYLQEFGEIGDGLKKLRAEIARLGGGGGTIQPLYGPAIRYAAQSGDADKISAIAKQAEDWLAQADDVRSALSDLKSKL